MIAPPLHNFLTDLVLAHHQRHCNDMRDCRAVSKRAVSDPIGIGDEKCTPTLPRVTDTAIQGEQTILINQQIVNIVQDNAYIHFKALLPPVQPGDIDNEAGDEGDFDSMENLDMSASERRWFNDASGEETCPRMRSARDTSLAKKPRIPRRRSSVDANSVEAAAVAAAAIVRSPGPHLLF